MKLNKLLASSAIAVTLAFSSLGTVSAGFEEAVKAYEAGDYATALKEWMVLADQNDPAAMRNIGHLHRRGLGTEQNYEKAMHWYKRASQFGFARAQANVASMYLRGQGVEQDYVQAADWFTKAARNGHVIAQYNLGLMYEHGKGVEKSVSKALAWYNLAAKAGHPKALDKLSLLVATDPDVKTASAEKEVAKDITEKVEPKTTQVTPPPAAPVVKEAPVEKTVMAEKPAVAIEAPKAVKEPTVAAKKAVAPNPVSAPTAQSPSPQKSIDPFAGSANNKLLAKDNLNAPVKEAKGAPTAFNSKQPAPAVEPALPKAEPAAKLASENVSAAPKVSAAQPSAEAQVVDTTSLKNEVPATDTVAAKAVTDTDAPPVKNSVAPENGAKSAAVTPNGEEKGFFASLKALVVGDDEDEKVSAANDTPTTVAVAPPSAIEAPTPKEEVKAVERVVPGSGLSISERLEMAELSFSLEQYQQALSVWAPLAQEGNAVAQYHLGQMFNEGFAVPVDRVKAHYWWSLAKKNGSGNAAKSLEQLEASLTFLEKQQLQQTN